MREARAEPRLLCWLHLSKPRSEDLEENLLGTGAWETRGWVKTKSQIRLSPRAPEPSHLTFPSHRKCRLPKKDTEHGQWLTFNWLFLLPVGFSLFFFHPAGSLGEFPLQHFQLTGLNYSLELSITYFNSLMKPVEVSYLWLSLLLKGTLSGDFGSGFPLALGVL